MQERMRRSTDQSSSESSDTQAHEAPVPTSVEGERIRDEIDDLLDEIDDVLESNAEEFVKNYVQKGGQ